MMKQSSTDIAIVGIGSLFPGATNTREFWLNILNKSRVLEEIPRDRWDWRLYYDEDRLSPDHVYSKWGGFIPEIPFDPLTYGIPPNSLKSVDPIQLLTLEVVRQALDDAGYLENDFDNEHTSVFIGATMAHGDMGQRLVARAELTHLLGDVHQDVLDRMPEWTETSVVGFLLNVLAGRVTNRFDLGGTNQIIDAACASSLASIAQACQELLYGDSNVAIAGGVDANQSPFCYVGFSKTQALSPQDRPRPFDQKADGIVLGEGIGMVVLKRYEDAIEENDRIYAVIKGWGGSSDGRAKSLFTPYPEGQARALRRAYKRAGFPISSVSLIEAHGTGTVAGDNTEIETIVSALSEDGAEPNSVLLRSIKSQIGHTKGTAGVAGLIEAALALHHRMLPPQMEVDEPLDIIANPETPVYLIENAHPWVRHPNRPRRAGVSSFGFGGTNFHVVLEETPDEHRKQVDADMAWSAELLLFRGEDRNDLERQILQLKDIIQEGAQPRLCDLAYSTILRVWEQKDKPATLAIVAFDLEHLVKVIDKAIPHLRGEANWPIDTNISIWDTPEAKGEKVALLFPGHGSHHARQGRELLYAVPELQNAMDRADELLLEPLGYRLSKYLYPPTLFDDDEEKILNSPLSNPHKSVLALAAFESGMVDLLSECDIKPDMTAGHSLGETAAFYYGGAIQLDDWYRYLERRMKLMQDFGDEYIGDLLAINLPRKEALELCEKYHTVALANHNAPDQTVVGGIRADIFALQKEMVHKGIRVYHVPLDGAYHTGIFEPLRQELTEMFSSLPVDIDWKIPIYDCLTGEELERGADIVRDRLANQLLGPIEWVKLMTNLFEEGARVFIETGPRAVLTNLHEGILGEDAKYWAVSLDGAGGGLRGMLSAFGKLAGMGVEFNLPRLYERRLVKRVDLDNLLETTKPEAPRPTTWYVNGGHARPMNEPIGMLGKEPALTVEAKEEMAVARSTNGSNENKMQPVPDPNLPPAIPTFEPGLNPQQVMAEYQRRMQLYLQHQEHAMQAYMSAMQQPPQPPQP